MAVEDFLSFCIDQLCAERCLICGAVLEGPDPGAVPVLPPGWHRDAISFFEADLSIKLFGFFGVSARLLCPTCWLTLEPARPLTGWRSVRAVPEEDGTGSAERADGGTSRIERVPIISPFFTNEALLEIVRDFKFSGGIRAAAPLSWWLAHALGRWLLQSGATGSDRLLITAVPLHPSRRRRRGYNQAALLGERTAERLGLPFAAGVLERARNTKSQSKLPEAKRAENVRDAFRVRRGADVRGCDVVIVDDLVTTGETALACVRALAGARPASIAVLSVGRTRSLCDDRLTPAPNP